VAAAGHRDFARGEQLKYRIRIGVGRGRRYALLMNQSMNKLHRFQKLWIIQI
jgi:hypothetical protein